MLVSSGAACTKKWSSIKYEKASILEVHSVGANNCFNKIWDDLFKMNKIVKKFLLTWEKFMSKMPLAQSGFTYSAYGPFSRPCETIKKKSEKQVI